MNALSTSPSLGRFEPKTIAQGIVGAPQISGDGGTVVWNQNVDGNVDIFRYRDGVVDRISSDERQDIHPSLNYDGSVISWSRFSTVDPNDPAGNFDVVAWRNGQETVLAEGPANQTDPTVSTNGGKIAWTTDLDGKDNHYAIQLHEKGQTRTLTAENEWNLYPVFSSDEGPMIWRSFNQDGSDVMIMDAQGNVKPVTQDNAEEVKPCITANGNTIFFHSPSPEGDDDLFRLDLEPHQFTAVAAEKEVDESWPVCTPDGQAVAWTNFDRRGGGETADTHIYLQQKGKTEVVSQGDGMHTNASIAADANKIAYLWLNPDDMDHRRIVLLQR